MGEAGEILEGNYYKDETIKDTLKNISLEYRNITDDFVYWQIANTLKRLGFGNLLEEFLSFCRNHDDQKIKDFIVNFLAR